MTNEDRKLCAQTWEQPHMRALRAELDKMAKTPGTPPTLDPGYDAIVMAAQAQWFAQGQASILETIDDLKIPKVERKDPGQPFQAPPEYLETRR